ncbi:glycosyltransferase family 4 protein [Desulfitobacterium sp.]|uniref:glycosyltransferase family 4 protein n=1 Tax=Desulfitobacterium sp. TaxID=49981 RepID=UPI002B2188DF|nr:glycosyltransferase family 4 protein [Desulfitobacterium sp.]MEA4903024.1 glycosyltransferase family 4 protein [Desulfitobacterium sp.]
MKILLATYWNIPHLGGVWPYMLQLKEKLESLNHEVDLLGYGDEAGSFVHLVNKKQLNTDKLLPLLKSMLNETDYPEIYMNKLIEYTEFRRYLFELSTAYFGLESYDVIHTQDVISAVSINRIRPPKAALVASLHGSVAHEIRLQLETIHKSPTSYMARRYFDQLEYNGASSAEYVILCNQWMKKILTDEFRVPNEKIKVFQYGYDIENFFHLMRKKSEIKCPANKKVIMYSGRLVQIKGVDHLLDALGRLKEERQDWICWIAGEGDKLAELRLQCKVLGLEEDVIFLGNRDDIPSLLAQADIFVLPSIIENQPLSIIEAQLAGKAIIASDAGGLPEMIQHKVTGLLTPVGNIECLCANLSKLLKSQSLRITLGSTAKDWALSHWSLDKIVNQTVEVYQKAITERRRNFND